MRTRTILLFSAMVLLTPLVPILIFYWGYWDMLFSRYSIATVAGLCALCYFQLALILSTRVKLIDRMLGHDRALRFHGYLALVAVFCAAGHFWIKKGLIEGPNRQTVPGGIGLLIFGLAAIGGLVFMTSGRIHRVAAIRAMKARVNRLWPGDYSRIKVYHNSAALAVLLMNLHVLMAMSVKTVGRRRWAIISIGTVALAAYVFHKFIRPWLRYLARWEVAGVSTPAEGITELSLKRARKLRGHRPGQFAYLRILSRKTGVEEHPFTVSSSPDAEELTFTIKDSGDYTARLTELEPGARAMVDGPYGLFTPAPGARQLLMIAGGIGITPFLSIIRSGLPDIPVTLIWTCKYRREMPHRDIIESYEAENSRFSFIPITTRETDGKDRSERIDQSLLEPVVGPACEVFICGPDPLRRSLLSQLKKLGLKSRQIHYESFAA